MSGSFDAILFKADAGGADELGGCGVVGWSKSPTMDAKLGDVK